MKRAIPNSAPRDVSGTGQGMFVRGRSRLLRCGCPPSAEKPRPMARFLQPAPGPAALSALEERNRDQLAKRPTCRRTDAMIGTALKAALLGGALAAAAPGSGI